MTTVWGTPSQELEGSFWKPRLDQSVWEPHILAGLPPCDPGMDWMPVAWQGVLVPPPPPPCTGCQREHLAEECPLWGSATLLQGRALLGAGGREPHSSPALLHAQRVPGAPALDTPCLGALPGSQNCLPQDWGREGRGYRGSSRGSSPRQDCCDGKDRAAGSLTRNSDLGTVTGNRPRAAGEGTRCF